VASQIARTAIYIDKYHPKAEGLCAISLRVTFDRKKKFYSIPISLPLKDFEKTQGNKPRKQFKETAMKLQSFENKALDIINKLPQFNWESFERYYLSNRASNNTINEAYENYSCDLRTSGNIGTAVSYECAKRSLHKFAPNTKFSQVTPDFLKKYERWMIDQGRSITTVGIYLITLRTLFNLNIEEGLLSRDTYPFGKRKYQIPTGNNVKKSLTLNEIAQIYYYNAEPGSMGEKCKDLWMFMYLCNGINMKDVCLLKYENIKGEILEFERAKTIRTKRRVEPIRVPLTDDAKSIIKKHGAAGRNPDTYIFGILKKGLTPERERHLIQLITRVVNNHMKKIALELGLKSEVTTYVARHSFATILQRSGVRTEFISEALGHSNVKTTQNYLAGFEDDCKKETAKALTAFKDVS
jgi:integrase